jgi:F-type H+-transporting ATPase subunit a
MIHISLTAEPIFQLGPFVVTNAELTALLGSLIIFLMLFTAARNISMKPKSRWSFSVELLFGAILDLIESVTQDQRKALQFFPLIMTFFIFIVINNWLGLLPGVGTITIHTAEGIVPLFRGANADLNTTLALAAISVIMTQIYAVKELGLFRHVRKYVSPNPILLFIGIIEFVSELSRMISFSFRLFGNIFAGEVLLVVIAFLAPLVGPLPFIGLELFVGLIQGLVFTMLTLAFLATATTAHDDHSHDLSEESKREPEKISVGEVNPVS